MRAKELLLLLAPLTAVAGCHDLPSDLDDYCHDSPMEEYCPVGVCSGPYECIAYCIEHFPEHRGIPANGTGSWCDDLGTPTDFGPFCIENPDVEGCTDWCTLHPSRC